MWSFQLSHVAVVGILTVCLVADDGALAKPLPVSLQKHSLEKPALQQNKNKESNQIPIPVAKDPPAAADPANKDHVKPAADVEEKNKQNSKNPPQIEDPRPGDERDKEQAREERQEGAGAGHGINEVQIQGAAPGPQKTTNEEKAAQEHPLKFKNAKQEKLKVEDIKPPDHLDAVKLEQDGHLNRDYLKEIFVGNHEELEKGTAEEQERNLADIFHRADVNKDGFVVHSELEDWILQKIQEHFDEAVEENQKVFSALDMDHNGFVSWNELCRQFLIAKGYDAKLAEKDPEITIMNLGNKETDTFHKLKFHWGEADQEPEDNQLSVEEFRSFRHPEQSPVMMKTMVKDILDSLDKNQDEILTEDEFIALPPGEVDEDGQASDRRWQEERRKEFRNDIDHNNDGKVTRDELMAYVNPKNPNIAKSEAKNLLSMADDNRDGKLSLDEVLQNKSIFLESKVVNTGWSFHSEL